MNHIIIIDDDHDYRKLVSTYLTKIFPEATVTEYDPIAMGVPGEDFDWSEYDFLILDYYLCIKNFTGLDLLKREQTNPSFPASVMLTGAGSEEVAAKSLKFGANKYINKQGLTKTHLKESIEEAWQSHQENLRKRKLIERRNHTFNKSRFYRELDATPGLDFVQTTRCIISMEVVTADDDASIDLLNRNSILKHLSLICFRFLSVRHPELCITTFTDNSLAVIVDFTKDAEAMKSEISALQNEAIKSPWRDPAGHIIYGISTAVIIMESGDCSHDDIQEQLRSAISRARTVASGNNHILLHRVTSSHEDKEQVVVSDTDATETSGDVEQQEPETADDKAETGSAGDATTEDTGQAADTTSGTDAESPSPESLTGEEPAMPSQEPESETQQGQPTTMPAAVEPVAETASPQETVSTTTVSPETTSVEEKTERTPSSSYEIELDESKLGDQDKKIIRALDERRIIQLFQPIIVFNNELFDYDEVFHVSLRMVDAGGDEASATEIFSTQENPEVSKYIDRWMIKEAISHIVDAGEEGQSPMFIIKLSHHSLSDTTLFNWLRALLSGFERFKPGEFITLEISMAALSHNRKQISALVQFLSKNYGFHFAIGHIESVMDIKNIMNLSGIHLLMLEADAIDELKTITVEEAPDENFVSALKKKQIYIITRDVHDSGELMAAIAAGADMAMGEFVGAAQTELDEMSNIESYELDKRLNSTIY